MQKESSKITKKKVDISVNEKKWLFKCSFVYWWVGLHRGLSKHQKNCSTPVTKVLQSNEGNEMHTMTATNGSNNRP